MRIYLKAKFTSAFVIVVVVDFITHTVHGAVNADSHGLCFRAESLGHREGNLYYCTDPSLPKCCERDNTHTCCQADVTRSFNDQAILWGFVCLTIVCFAAVYYHFSREGDYWESDTVRQAADHMARRFGITVFTRRKRENDGLTPMQKEFDTVPEEVPSTDGTQSGDASIPAVAMSANPAV